MSTPMRHKLTSDADRRRAALQRFIDERGLEVADWARRAGLPTDTSIHNFLKGRSDSLSVPTLEALARAEDVSIGRLLTTDSFDERVSKSHPSKNGQMVSIPEVDVRAGAGGFGLTEHNGPADGRKEAVLNYWELPRDFLSGHTASLPQGFRIIRVQGDSMTPEIMPGQRLLVDTNDRAPTPPGIFVVFDGFGLVVKRVYGKPFSEPPTVVISSDNEKYPPYERTLEEAHIQGRVIGEWRWR